MVPILEPKTTPTACVSPISSADRNEMMMTDTSDELCTTAVARKPVPIARGVVLVNFSSTISSAPPLNSLKPSSM